MLSNIINSLNTSLQETGLFAKLFCLCEPIRNANGVSAPMEYTGKGQYKQVSNFDKYAGMGYWRKQGFVSVSAVQDANSPACDYLQEFTYGLRFVGAIPISNLSIDDIYSEDRICEVIIKNVIKQSTSLKYAIQAKKVEVTTGGYETNGNVILAQEYDGIEKVDVNYKFKYFSIGFDVKVLIKKDCIIETC
jgi:hypothetical protein